MPNFLYLVPAIIALAIAGGCTNKSSAPASGANQFNAGIASELFIGRTLPKTIPVTPPAPPNPCAPALFDLTGTQDVSAALNTCIASLSPGATLMLPAGTYLIGANPILIGVNHITITTQGLLGSTSTCVLNPEIHCATFKASPTYAAGSSVVLIASPSGPDNQIVLDHLTIDGNGAQRRANGLGVTACAKHLGNNLLEYGGTGNVLQYCASIDAECGTSAGWAMGYVGQDNLIQNNYFANNGVGYDVVTGQWSDGLTIGQLSGSQVLNNVMQDNSDVGLIIGAGTNGVLMSGNKITQTSSRIFAAFMMTNWSDPNNLPNAQWADFRGFQFSNNQITCGSFCDIGIVVGTLAWRYDPTYWVNLRTMGGIITGNSIATNKQFMLLSGAGTPDYEVAISNNTTTSTPSKNSLYWAPSGTMTDRINVYNLGYENFVNFQNGQDALVDSANPWHGLY